MSLYFRRQMMRRRARPHAGQVALNEAFVISSKVGVTDQDMFGHMNNSRYADFTELAAENFLIRSGLADILTRRKLRLVTRSESLLFHRMMRFPQRFVVTTTCAGWTNDRLGLIHNFSGRKKHTADSLALLGLVNESGEPVSFQPVIDELGERALTITLPDDFMSLQTSR